MSHPRSPALPRRAAWARAPLGLLRGGRPGRPAVPRVRRADDTRNAQPRAQTIGFTVREGRQADRGDRLWLQPEPELDRGCGPGARHAPRVRGGRRGGGARCGSSRAAGLGSGVQGVAASAVALARGDPWTSSGDIAIQATDELFVALD